MPVDLTDVLERVAAPPMHVDIQTVLARGRRRRLRQRLRRGGTVLVAAAAVVPALSGQWPGGLLAPTPADVGRSECRVADLGPDGPPPNGENGVSMGGTPWLDTGPPAGERSVRVQVHTDTCEGLAVAVSRGGGKAVSAGVTTAAVRGRPEAAFWLGEADGGPLDRLGNPTPVTVQAVVLLPAGQRLCGATLRPGGRPIELPDQTSAPAGPGWSVTVADLPSGSDLEGATMRICAGDRTVAPAVPQFGFAAPRAPITAVPTTATVDVTTGLIALPYDAYRPSQVEDQEIVSAGRVAMITCQQRHGVTPADKIARVIPDPPPRRFGVWRMADATRYGYVDYTSDAKARAIADQSTSVDPALAAQQAAAAATCVREDDVLRRLNEQPADGAWSTEISAAESRAESSAPYRAAVEDWARCLHARGIETEPGMLVPAGLDTDAIDERRVEPGDVTIAVADVTCKQQTNTVQRLTDILAAAQAPLVVKYQGPLREQRAMVDSQLVLARQVLRDAGL